MLLTYLAVGLLHVCHLQYKNDNKKRLPPLTKKSVFYLGRQQVQFVFRSLGEGKSEDLLELLSI